MSRQVVPAGSAANSVFPSVDRGSNLSPVPNAFTMLDDSPADLDSESRETIPSSRILLFSSVPELCFCVFPLARKSVLLLKFTLQPLPSGLEQKRPSLRTKL